MELGELPDTTASTVPAPHPHQMEQRLYHMRRWITHLVGKLRNLGDENSMLRDLTHQQANRIKRLEGGILVSPFSTWPQAIPAFTEAAQNVSDLKRALTCCLCKEILLAPRV